MKREEALRIRRELGLDLAEAGRKAGVVAPLQQRTFIVSGNRNGGDGEDDEGPAVYFSDFAQYEAWCDDRRDKTRRSER